MKKIYTILTLCLLCSLPAFSQDELLEELFGRNILFEIPLRYSNNNNYLTLPIPEGERPVYHSIGVGINAGAWHLNRHSIYLAMAFDYGFSGKNRAMDMPISLNYGYEVLSLENSDLYLTPHVGLGVLQQWYYYTGETIICNNILYDDELLAQTSGLLNFGIKLSYKHIFLDLSYNLEFLKSHVKVITEEEFAENFDNDFDKALSLDKRNKTNFSGVKQINCFPVVLSLGYVF